MAYNCGGFNNTAQCRCMRKARIYFDNCCLNRPFDDQSKIRNFLETQAKIYVQSLIINKSIEFAYSYMSVFENRNNPNEDNGRIIEDFFVYATTFVDPDKETIVEQRAEIIKTQGIKNKDAIHLACAIEAECDYFLTTDDGILKRYAEKDIKVYSPIEFAVLYEMEGL